MPPLDLLGSVLNFAGGVVLTLDALRVRSNIRVEDGVRHLQQLLDKAGAGHILTDQDGKSLHGDASMQLWLSSRSLRWAWIGFALMTAGFLADLLGHWAGGG